MSGLLYFKRVLKQVKHKGGGAEIMAHGWWTVFLNFRRTYLILNVRHDDPLRRTFLQGSPNRGVSAGMRWETEGERSAFK